MKMQPYLLLERELHKITETITGEEAQVEKVGKENERDRRLLFHKL